MASANDAKIERMLKALANRRRIAILRILKKRKAVTVGDIAAAIKLSFKATSKHLGILSAADLVEREQKNLNMYYSLSSALAAEARTVVSIL